MSIDSDVIRGHVDTIILKTLTTGEKYGYEIIKEIEQKSNGTYELKQPTLYSCLKRLENQGLISGFTKNSDIGGKRHYYKLTKKGRDTYEESMQQWFNSRSIIDNLMGSKPTEMLLDENTEIAQQTTAPLPEKIEESALQTPDLIQENQTNSEQASTQMTLDEESNIIEDDEPRNFNIENIDENDAKLLGDYYKTDENQINLFGTSEIIHETEEKTSSAIFDENDIDTESCNNDYSFKNYNGTDVSKYRQNNKDNYFEKISYGFVDEKCVNETNELNIISEEVFEDQEDQTQEEEQKPTFSPFQFFTNYPTENGTDENQNNFSNEDSEDTQNIFYDNVNKDEEDDNETLNFGFDYDQESDEDDVQIPTTFDDELDEEIEEDYTTNNISSISIFGEDDDDYNDYTHSPTLEEEIHIQPQTTTNPQSDLKPYNIGTYTEPKYKEKLNQLSAYTKNNYDTKVITKIDNSVCIESRSITELKDDLNKDGIEVRSYSKPVKEALKDKKYLLVNKIKFATSWIVFGIMSILLTITYFIAKSVGYTNLMLIENAMPVGTYFILASIITLIIPLTHTIIYLLNKTKKIKPNYSAMISLVFALLFFIVCLNIIYTLNILNGFTKFTQKDYNHLLWLLPCVDATLIIFQSAIYSLLFKSKRFNA